MHVLFVSEYYPPKSMGGGEINLALTAQALAKEGLRISVLTSKFPGLSSEEESKGVKIYRRLKTGKTPGSFASNLRRFFLLERSVVKETKRHIDEHQPDVIHFQGNTLLAAPHLKELGKPLFATVESYPTLCPKGDRLYKGKETCTISCSFKKFLLCQYFSPEIGKMQNKWYFKYNLPLLFCTYGYYKKLRNALGHCHLIAISAYMQHILRLHNQDSVAIIPNSIPHAFFSQHSQNSPDWQKKNNTKINLLYLGTLSKAKGAHLLIEALHEIGVPCRTDLYGDGPLKKELQQKIKEYGLDAEVHPFVSQEKVKELYHQSDVVVVPALWPEPFGRIPLEAIAAGKPVIASSVGAVREIPSKGVFFIEPGNILALRQAITAVFLTCQKSTSSNSKREATRMNVEVLDKYSEKSITQQHLSLYTKSLSLYTKSISYPS